MSIICKTTVLALATGTLLWGSVASADGWPATVAGNWSVIGNQSIGTLSITQFAGAAGSQCKPIRGTIYTSPIEGFYCPGSGRLSFARRISATNATVFQYWSGNLSQRVTSSPLRIGGSFAAFPHNNVSGTTGGSLGEYNFSATHL
jgi:hypothetical protein